MPRVINTIIFSFSVIFFIIHVFHLFIIMFSSCFSSFVFVLLLLSFFAFSYHLSSHFSFVIFFTFLFFPFSQDLLFLFFFNKCLALFFPFLPHLGAPFFPILWRRACATAALPEQVSRTAHLLGLAKRAERRTVFFHIPKPSWKSALFCYRNTASDASVKHSNLKLCP